MGLPSLLTLREKNLGEFYTLKALCPEGGAGEKQQETLNPRTYKPQAECRLGVCTLSIPAEELPIHSDRWIPSFATTLIATVSSWKFFFKEARTSIPVNSINIRILQLYLT